MNRARPHSGLLEHLVHLSSVRDVELLEFSLLRTLCEFLPSAKLRLLRFDADGQLRSARTCCPDDRFPEEIAPEDVPVEIAACVDAAMRSGEVHRAEAHGRSVLACPIVLDRTHDLCLLVDSDEPLPSEDERIVDALVRIFRNFCALMDEAQRDQLTGLLNRKTFDEAIQNVLAEALRAPVDGPPPGRRRQDREPGTTRHWLGMIDIDHFKRINDTFGHLYGDEVLLLVAQLMRRSFRETDLLFRFGGEEFVVIAENVDQQGAERAFERFRETIAAHSFPQVGKVTISCGVTRAEPGTPAPTLLDRADQALYQAKSDGRDRVYFYEKLVASGVIQATEVKVGSIELF